MAPLPEVCCSLLLLHCYHCQELWQCWSLVLVMVARLTLTLTVWSTWLSAQLSRGWLPWSFLGWQGSALVWQPLPGPGTGGAGAAGCYTHDLTGLSHSIMLHQATHTTTMYSHLPHGLHYSILTSGRVVHPHIRKSC